MWVCTYVCKHIFCKKSKKNWLLLFWYSNWTFFISSNFSFLHYMQMSYSSSTNSEPRMIRQNLIKSSTKNIFVIDSFYSFYTFFAKKKCLHILYIYVHICLMFFPTIKNRKICPSIETAACLA